MFCYRKLTVWLALAFCLRSFPSAAVAASAVAASAAAAADSAVASPTCDGVAEFPATPDGFPPPGAADSDGLIDPGLIDPDESRNDAPFENPDGTLKPEFSPYEDKITTGAYGPRLALIMRHNVPILWSRDVSADTKRGAAEATLAAVTAMNAMGLAEAGDPVDVSRSEHYENLLELRMNASGNTRDPSEGFQAQANIRAVDAIVRGWALDPSKTTFTLDDLREINRGLGNKLRMDYDVAGVAGVAGRLRERNVRSILNRRMFYVHHIDVPRFVCDFINDVNTWLGNADMSAIEIAAMIYQRCVSIHPFSDANGRTCRMAADFALQRRGSPPALFDGEDREAHAAVYGLYKPVIDRDYPTQAMTRSVLRSVEVLADRYLR